MHRDSFVRVEHTRARLTGLLIGRIMLQLLSGSDENGTHRVGIITRCLFDDRKDVARSITDVRRFGCEMVRSSGDIIAWAECLCGCAFEYADLELTPPEPG